MTGRKKEWICDAHFACLASSLADRGYGRGAAPVRRELHSVGALDAII